MSIRWVKPKDSESEAPFVPSYRDITDKERSWQISLHPLPAEKWPRGKNNFCQVPLHCWSQTCQYFSKHLLFTLTSIRVKSFFQHGIFFIELRLTIWKKKCFLFMLKTYHIVGPKIRICKPIKCKQNDKWRYTGRCILVQSYIKFRNDANSTIIKKCFYISIYSSNYSLISFIHSSYTKLLLCDR